MGDRLDVIMQGTVFLDIVMTGIPALPTAGTELDADEDRQQPHQNYSDSHTSDAMNHDAGAAIGEIPGVTLNRSGVE